MAESVSKLAAIAIIFLASISVAGQVKERQCGFDRWPVKTLTDRDRGRVNFKPRAATVAELAALKIHEIPYPRDRRIEPEELIVYKVRARFLQLRREKDRDLHLLIADLERPHVQMIVEIPAPECARGSGREDDFDKAREIAQQLRRGDLIEVVGVGFFDFIHNPPIGAQNGFELHPVLAIRRE